jgi:hypothetical protein
MREHQGIKFAQDLTSPSAASTQKSVNKTITPAKDIVDQMFVPSSQDDIQKINSDSEVDESEMEDNGEPEFEKFLFLKGLELQRIQKADYSLLGAIGKSSICLTSDED